MPEVSQYPPGTCCWLELTTLRPRNEAHQPWVSTNLSRLIRMVREDECGRFRLVHLAPASCNVSIAPWAVHLASRRVSRLDFVRFLESGWTRPESAHGKDPSHWGSASLQDSRQYMALAAWHNGPVEILNCGSALVTH
jgi:hypothetical protein